MTLLLLLLLAAVAVTPGRAPCPHESADLKPWSAADSWSTGQVPTGGDVTIDTPIRLNISTPSMGKITITSGGKLVFDPTTSSLKLSASMVELTGGELWIGSEDCPYLSDAEVLLTGRRDESKGAASVQKAILVREGVLEVHGKPKRSWTRLASTILKTSREEITSGAIHSVTDSENTSGNGVMMFEFDNLGNPVRNWRTVFGPNKYNVVAGKTGNVAVIVVKNNVRFGDFTADETTAALENLCYGGQRRSAMRDLVEGELRSFAAICHIGSPENSVELVGTINNDRSQTGWLRQTIGGVEFAAMSVISMVRFYPVNRIEMISFPAGSMPSPERTLNLVDAVDTWHIGDRIVLASTDHQFRQAEEFELLDCPSCSDTQVKVEGPVWFTHWGEITDGVDMRGEVGLLTRNVRFHGQMEDECYGGNLCNKFDYDTFGGHIKFLQDFQAARIENAEFYHMGQQAVKGSYPIHFHMCLDTSSKNVYIRQNTIRNTFSRCLTIHGTHNVTVQNNIAYDHMGHCYFLEDGGEQDNRLEGNLGLSTKPGTLLPSDILDKVSTFWITNPDNELINNTAAGSDGIGIWTLMPLLPTGPSANVDMGLTSGQTFRTVVKAFSGNVAHSNRRFGFRLDDLLKNDGNFGAPMNYMPLVDPTDPKSDLILLHFDTFTAYKNSEGVWIKSMLTLCTNFCLAENNIGLVFDSAGPEYLGPHHEMLANSRVVGDTANKGEPAGSVEIAPGQFIQLDRSLARHHGKNAQIGIAFYRGPVHVVNTSFAGFKANALRGAGAIGKKPSNPYFSSPIASVRNATFDYVDPSGGSRFYDGDGTVRGYEERDGNRHNIVLDWDGSLTTYPRASVVRPIPMLMNARCVLMPNWGPGAGLCPDRFSRIKFQNPDKPPVFMTRNDLMSSEVEVPLRERQISFSLNTRESYIMHFNTTVPEKFYFHPYGLERGLVQKVAVCVGVNQEVKVSPNSYTAAQTMDEVDADDSNSKYFYDAAVGVVNFRFTNPYPRGEHTTSHCPGELDDDLNGKCAPVVSINLPAANDDGDCRERAYPAYKTEPVSAEGALAVPVFS